MRQCLAQRQHERPSCPPKHGPRRCAAPAAYTGAHTVDGAAESASRGVKRASMKSSMGQWGLVRIVSVPPSQCQESRFIDTLWQLASRNLGFPRSPTQSAPVRRFQPRSSSRMLQTDARSQAVWPPLRSLLSGQPAGTSTTPSVWKPLTARGCRTLEIVASDKQVSHINQTFYSPLYNVPIEYLTRYTFSDNFIWRR